MCLADSEQWLSRWRSRHAPHIYELCGVKEASGCPATKARLPMGAVPLYRRAQSPPPTPLLGGKGGQRGATKEIYVLYNEISRQKQADGTLSKKRSDPTLYQDVAYRLTVQLRPPNGIIHSIAHIRTKKTISLVKHVPPRLGTSDLPSGMPQGR